MTAALKQYFAWDERQVRRNASNTIGENAFPMRKLLIDKGDEVTSAEFTQWLYSRGIKHVGVGLSSSQQNPCERVHRKLMEMTRAMV